MKDIQTLLSPSKQDEFSNEQTLVLIGLAGLAALLISVLPIINILDYPFRLLLTIIHELGHGFAALLTGGHFQNFVIFSNGAGLAYTAGGWRFLIIPMGYLSVAIFAAALISLGRSHYWSRIALGIIGLAMIILSFWFGRPGEPGLFAILNSVLGLFMGVIFGALFLWVAFKANPAMIIFFLHLTAIKAGFTAFSDLFALIGLTTRGSFHASANDAQSMAELTRIPAVIWAVLWVVIAAFIIGGAIKATWFTKRNG